MESFLIILTVGILSCAILDAWQRVLFFLAKVPPTNWAIVGRWLILFLKSRTWVQNDLSEQAEFSNELSIGWIFHYTVAIAYACFYFFLYKQSLIGFSFFDGLVFGLLSVLVPWFFFMPAMGAGLLAIKTPKPVLACFLALVAHGVFGGAIGLLFSILYY